MLLYIWLGAVVAAIWTYFRRLHSRFSRYGVKNIPPIPIFGNGLLGLSRKEHLLEELDRIYKAFPDEKFVGRFELMNALVMLRDIDLIKKITVKDFDYFLDHRAIVDENNDPFFGRNLFSLKGQEWKDMRSTLSPAFTSSKIRLMVPFMVEVGNQMMDSLKKKIQESDDQYIDIDVKDLTTRYANDVIASCAFGLKVNSHVDVNNEFYLRGKGALNFDTKQVFKFLGFSLIPTIMKIMKVKLFSEETTIFFKNMVTSTMRDREQHNIVRPDMIQLLMEAKKGKLVHDDKSKDLVKGDADAGFATVEESAVGQKKVLREWSDNDIIAQAVLFFIAGFETVSTTMSFALHELAVNPEVQERLLQEIKENEAKNGGKFDYKSIQNMTYMDMVVSEVLRLWPAAMQLDRICVKDYNLGKPNSKSTQDYVIRAGEGLIIPLYSLHRDPKYYADPDKFDPERFSEKNKHKIQPFAYLPFGSGARNCIGSRFALCEVKVMLYQLLQQLQVFPCAKTCIPSRVDKNAFTFSLHGGHWVRLTIRN